ncbi:myoD family inhibitor domain-containing protein isoform X2 [Rattus norvegicus]|uniref:myoD family inhibitor domain-containing protein isoform X2 n=1 Tax=Rattus norvegicus TaxID=10116 RepID=UPI0003D0F17D|nr:myoD family inhibitor domain-containing protein isoform X2 [Rattus norvegicus]|eukprot:XP_006236165.1 PREDICTED: myoD family inhibitor domain-containing protein isoform X2 [Rattus norvegicus]
MSGAGEALPPGPVGQQCPAEAGGGRLGSPAHEECNEDTTEKEKRQTTSSHTRCGLIRDQSIWRNPSDGELVRTQPERLPQLQTSAQEPSKEETSKIQNGGHTTMNNGNGIPHRAKHMSMDNHKMSSPVSQKMHRKIQSSLSVNNDVNKKSKVNAVFSQKSASSPEACTMGLLHPGTIPGEPNHSCCSPVLLGKPEVFPHFTKWTVLCLK